MVAAIQKVKTAGEIGEIGETFTAGRGGAHRDVFGNDHPPSRVCREADVADADAAAEAGGSELTPAQRQAIARLVAGQPPADVARAMGIARSTLYRWKADEPFAAVLRGRQEAILDGAGDRLRAMLGRVLDEVEAELCSPHHHIRLQTAYRLLPYVASRRLRPPPPPKDDPAIRGGGLVG